MLTDWIQDIVIEEPETDVSMKAAFVQNQENQFNVLLGKHSVHQKYMLPGGRVDYHDLVAGKWYNEQALCRELQEELGLNIWDVFHKYYPIGDYTLPPNEKIILKWEHGSRTKLDVCYMFLLPSDYTLPFNTARLPKASEIIHTLWVPWRDISVDIFPNTRAVLEFISREIDFEA